MSRELWFSCPTGDNIYSDAYTKRIKAVLSLTPMSRARRPSVAHWLFKHNILSAAMIGLR